MPSRWRLPAAPATAGGELPGTAMLREAGAMAPPLWRCLRGVIGWAAAAPDQRETLFTPEMGSSLAEEARTAGLPERAVQPVLVVAEVLGQPPAESHGARLSEACASLARWASESYMPTAAAEFAAAAAAAQPGSAGYARAAGDAYRRAGRTADAASMYRRAITLARMSRDWDCYVASHAALGRVAQLRGDLAAARRSLERALRRSAPLGDSRLRASLCHELFRLEVRAGRPEEAELHGAEAAALYPADDPGLRELAAEAVAGWLEEGRQEDAYPVLAALAAASSGPVRLRALGALARAGSVLPDHQEAVAGALDEILAEPLGSEGRASALLEAAEAALLLGWVDRADAAARAALGSATRVDEPGGIAAARSLLTRSAARRMVGPAAAGRRSPRAPGPLADALAKALGR
jgi:tetratricopeptide (TPR) repeat protein